MIDLDTVLQGHLEDFYQACTQTAINEAYSVCEDGYYGNKDQFISSFILPVCHLFQTLKKVKQMSLFLKLLIPGILTINQNLTHPFTGKDICKIIMKFPTYLF